MKTNAKLKLAATAAAVLAAGLLSQTAQAGAVLNHQYDATLQNMSELGFNGNTFVVRSSAMLVTSGPNTGDYYYSYDFGVSTDPDKNGPPVGLASLSVYFNTVATGAFGAGGYSGPPPGPGVAASTQIVAADVNWTFNPVSNEETVYFFSPDAPGFGTVTAQNGGLWSQVANSSALTAKAGDSLVVVPILPSVPDTATTFSLLGGAIVGLGALRRKIGC